jgi:hypothetical protein
MNWEWSLPRDTRHDVGMIKQHLLTADFVVAGGGLSGVCAALAAARNGARVVLVQDRSVLGGNASSEIRMHIVGADCHGKKPGARESGIMEELRLEDSARNPHRSYSQWDLLLYEKVKAEPLITLLLDTDVTQVVMEGDRIVAAKAERISTQDEFELRAKFFADCTGDGRLGAEAGANCQIGREGRDRYGERLAQEVGDRKTLGSSILLTARKYDTPQPFRSPDWSRKFSKETFKLRPISSYEYGYWWFEWGGQLDTIKDNEAIRHELLRIAMGVWDYIKNSGEHPDAANWALDWVGAIPGKRESRRFLGPRVLTEQDVMSPGLCPDAVAYGGWFIDTHPPMGVDAPDEPPCVHHRFDHLYGIPLGCYHSRNVPNLFFAGRNISASHIAFASTRVMATCAVGGQAIGTAAALWRDETQTDIRALATPDRVRALQQRLLKDDAFLPGLHAEDPADWGQRAKFTASSGEASAELVKTGVTRNLQASFGEWSSDALHAWMPASLPAELNLIWSEKVEINEVHVTFDSGFERQLILSLSEWESRRVIRGPQPETAKRYRLKLDGEVVFESNDNILRKRVHRLPIARRASQLTLEVLESHGAKTAGVFEVRVY